MVRLRVPVVLLALGAMIPTISASAQSQQGEDIVSASTLTRTHTVAPAWPQSAAEGVEGWVMMRFTVLPDGTVADVEVVRANPNGVFEESALEALRQWKFEPVQRNGEKVAQRAEIRFNYARN